MGGFGPHRLAARGLLSNTLARSASLKRHRAIPHPGHRLDQQGGNKWMTQFMTDGATGGGADQTLRSLVCLHLLGEFYHVWTRGRLRRTPPNTGSRMSCHILSYCKSSDKVVNVHRKYSSTKFGPACGGFNPRGGGVLCSLDRYKSD